MKIFITGGSGFIGRALAPLLLSRGHKLLILTRQRELGASREGLDTLVGDLMKPLTYRPALESFSPDCSIHLGWQGLPDYSLENCKQNLLAGLGLFEQLREINCKKVIAVGTCWEYGALTGPANESQIGVSVNLFAAFKLGLKGIAESFFAGTETQFVWLRPFFIYGPGQRSLALIPTVLRSLQLGEPLPVQKPGAVNDFIHVDDVASAIHQLIQSCQTSGVFNIGTGKPRAVWEVVNIIATILGLRKPYHNFEIDLNQACWANTDKLASFGWRPNFDLEQGIHQTVKSCLL